MRIALFLILVVSLSGVTFAEDGPPAVTYLGTHLLPRTHIVVKGRVVTSSRLGTGSVLARVAVEKVLYGKTDLDAVVLLSVDPSYFPARDVPVVFFLKRLGGGRFEPLARVDLLGRDAGIRFEMLRLYLEIEAVEDLEEKVRLLHDLLMGNLRSGEDFRVWSAARELAHFTGLHSKAFTDEEIKEIEVRAASAKDPTLRDLLVNAAENLGSAGAGTAAPGERPRREPRRTLPPPREFKQMLAIWEKGGLAADEREMIVNAASVRHLKHALPILLEAARDPDVRIRLLAVRYLGEGLFLEAEQPLLELLATEKDSRALDTVIQSLGILRSEKALPSIILHAGTPELTRTVAFAAARIRSPAALEFLQVLLAESAGSGQTKKEMRDLVEYLLSELFVKQEEALEKVRRRRLR